MAKGFLAVSLSVLKAVSACVLVGIIIHVVYRQNIGLQFPSKVYYLPKERISPGELQTPRQSDGASQTVAWKSNNSNNRENNVVKPKESEPSGQIGHIKESGPSSPASSNNLKSFPNAPKENSGASMKGQASTTVEEDTQVKLIPKNYLPPEMQPGWDPTKPEVKVSRYPKALIIGAAKCGTAALATFLGLHPDLAVMPWETDFFCDRTYGRYSIKWYRDIMPVSTSHQITIEKSPCYFFEPEALMRIHAYNSSIKLIVTVKDPITWILSKRAHDQKKGPIHFRLAAAMPLDDFVLDNNGTARPEAVKAGNFLRHMEQVYNIFPRDQILVLDGDKLVTDPLSQLTKAEDFLGVRHYLSEKDVYYDKNKGFYCYRNRETREAKCFNSSKGREHEKMSDTTYRTLQAALMPNSVKFLQLIGQKLDWDLGT